MSRNSFRLTPQGKPKLVENDVEKACVDLLRMRGYYVVRLQSGLFKTSRDKFLRVGERGIPDYVAVHARYPGFFMETKRPGGSRSPEQIAKHRELTLAYRLAVVTVDSVEVLAAFLGTHERG